MLDSQLTLKTPNGKHMSHISNPPTARERLASCTAGADTSIPQSFRPHKAQPWPRAAPSSRCPAQLLFISLKKKHPKEERAQMDGPAWITCPHW